jgi:hypothetical protein
MQGGLANEVAGPSVTAVATGQTQTSDPALEREAVRIGRHSLTLEELLAIAIVVEAVATTISLYLEVRS